MREKLEKIACLARSKINAATNREVDNLTRIKQALFWLYRAQDATADRGVSHSYKVGMGWTRSYPETTGYIIPTLINCWRLLGEVEAKNRAIEMANWELDVQLASGAIPSLINNSAVVFDTGQVIFGWIEAYQTTADKRYFEAAIKAGNWLIKQLDDKSTWSSFGNPGYAGVHTYNIRAAWALLILANISGDSCITTYMSKLVNWTLEQEDTRGWFKNNCLSNNDCPLLHTIAYTCQGLLECGILLSDMRCIDVVTRTSDELARLVAPSGRMSGRYDAEWHPVVRWSCLTGMAQTAIVWQRLDRLNGTCKYSEPVTLVNSFLKTCQDVNTLNFGVRGGIMGSYPIYGAYGPWSVLNWATKFFIDDMLLESFPADQFPLY